jgi:nucleotide-binding universal stress UspA family protein
MRKETMRSFGNILVDIDSTASAHPELEAATRVARRSGSRLRVVDAAPRAATVLVREAERFGHDLVVRSHARDLVGRSGSINLHLFRHSPSAVWAVGPGPLRENPRIVAAVDASSPDSVTQILNRKAIEMALQLARAAGGSVIVLQAWRPVAEKQLSVYATEEEFALSVDEAHCRAGNDLALLVDSFGDRLAGVRVELRKGLPEEVIPAFVVAEGVDIVVAGARGETGIWHRLFGSTAERLLHATPCSVVAVKPGT